MINFLFALLELFSLSITVRELWSEMCTARLFSHTVDLFALKFCLDMVVSHQSFLASENERYWATDGEDRIPLGFYHFDTIRTDRRTDGRICPSMCSYSLHSAVKIMLSVISLLQKSSDKQIPVCIVIRIGPAITCVVFLRKK